LATTLLSYKKFKTNQYSIYLPKN